MPNPSLKLTCPYCGYEKSDELFTDEHVLPQSLGGNLQPTNPLLCRVCKSCNSACGRWIDGRVARSCLIHATKSLSAHRLKKQPATALPLVFIGQLADWADSDGTVCDFWLAAPGNHVYHFHQPYDNGELFAGRPPHVPGSQLDPGTAFVGFVVADPDIHRAALASVRSSLGPLPTLRLTYSDETTAYPDVASTPLCEAEERQLAWINALPPGQALNTRHAVEFEFGRRFLIKFALGIGVCTLGPEYAVSAHARTLRTALWRREDSATIAPRIRMSSFLDDHRSLTPRRGDAIWTLCSVVCRKRQPSALRSTTTHPSKRASSRSLRDWLSPLFVTSTKSRWRARPEMDYDALELWRFPMRTIDEVVEETRSFPIADRLRLAERIIHEVVSGTGTTKPKRSAIGWLADQPETADQLQKLTAEVRAHGSVREFINEDAG